MNDCKNSIYILYRKYKNFYITLYEWLQKFYIEFLSTLLIKIIRMTYHPILY